MEHAGNCARSYSRMWLTCVFVRTGFQWTLNSDLPFLFRVAFQAGPNLQDILYKNKDKLIPNSCPKVYKVKCLYGSVYDSGTKKKIISRSIEHQQESIKGN